MRINAKILKNVADVNTWQYANQAYIQEGQANSIYIQLVDLDKTHPDEKSEALPDFPVRYIPQGAVNSVSMTFLDIDSDTEFSVTGSQPFADDKSIWKIDLTDAQLPNTGSVKVSLDEDGTVMQFLLKGALSVELLDVGGC